ncbi:hypothetical protein OC834_003862 [Tilletia horrida]|nr:hypothetical protein OC834_003862 [Tilletia horrida]KAK0559942.1 hypothetical protein OC844_004082 [Tilletia horrida]
MGAAVAMVSAALYKIVYLFAMPCWLEWRLQRCYEPVPFVALQCSAAAACMTSASGALDMGLLVFAILVWRIFRP